MGFFGNENAVVNGGDGTAAAGGGGGGGAEGDVKKWGIGQSSPFIEDWAFGGL